MRFYAAVIQWMYSLTQFNWAYLSKWQKLCRLNQDSPPISLRSSVMQVYWNSPDLNPLTSVSGLPCLGCHAVKALEMSGNVFFNPIPSHSQRFIPILILKPRFSLVSFPFPSHSQRFIPILILNPRFSLVSFPFPSHSQWFIPILILNPRFSLVLFTFPAFTVVSASDVGVVWWGSGGGGRQKDSQVPAAGTDIQCTCTLSFQLQLKPSGQWTALDCSSSAT